MDFNDPLFEGKKGMYRKCSWSKQCEALGKVLIHYANNYNKNYN